MDKPAEIDAEVSLLISQGQSLYGIFEKELINLHPDIILTQDICNVCAIDLVTVERIVSKMSPSPRIISLNPYSLDDVLANIDSLGTALNLQDNASAFKLSLEKRIEYVQKLGSMRASPINVGFIEWSDPIYVGGHWTPQLIQMAGGSHPLNPSMGSNGAGKSFPVPPEVFAASDPDVIIISPCGFDLELAIGDAESLLKKKWFAQLRAVKAGNVYVVDGDAMFNRPGPRLVDALEWLAFIFSGEDKMKYPELAEKCPGFPYEKIDCSSAVTTSNAELNTTSANLEMKNSPLPQELSIEEAHLAACNRGDAVYLDPKTGYSVFTEVRLLKRAKCCGNKCRHCPYGHYNVPASNRANTIKKPLLLRVPVKGGAVYDSKTDGSLAGIDVLFWSGGKDSYLAYLHLLQQSASTVDSSTLTQLPTDTLAGDISDNSSIKYPRKIVLLTTINQSDGQVPYQNVSLHQIMDQSKVMSLDHMMVPLPDMCNNADYIARVLSALGDIEVAYGLRAKGADRNTQDMNERGRMRLLFGDLHLQDMMDWRRASLINYTCFFPLFNVPYTVLLSKLFSQVQVSHQEHACSSSSAKNDNRTSSGSQSLAVAKITITSLSNTQTDGTRHPNLDPMVQVGSEFTAELVSKLPADWDIMGENGELHTYVHFNP